MGFLFRHSKDSATANEQRQQDNTPARRAGHTNTEASAQSERGTANLRGRVSDTSVSNSALRDSSISAAELSGESISGESTFDDPSFVDVNTDGDVRRWRAGSTGRHRAKTQRFSRRRAVADICQQWRAELTDTDAISGTAHALTKTAVDLTHAHPTGAAQLFSGASTLMSSLVREERAYKRASHQLGELHNLVMRLNDSYGYARLALTAGRATWMPATPPASPHEASSTTTPESAVTNTDEAAVTNTDEAAVTQRETEPKSKLNQTPQPTVARAAMPMLLRPVNVTFMADGNAKIRLTKSISINPHFRAALSEAGAPEHTLNAVQALADSSATVDEVLAKLADVARTHLTHFEHEPQALLGCFTHPSELLVRDFDAITPLMREAGVVAALAGDEDMREITAAPLLPGIPQDRTPEVERGVGDRDVDEQRAVEAVAAGRSIVLDCPPGSQRLGTIVSIAADAAASGRSVLIVPAHGADGAALQREFEAAGVGELVLNFWDTDSAALRLRLGLRLDKPNVDRAEILETRNALIDARMKLSTFVNDLHREDPEWETSVHDLLEKLAELASEPHGPRTCVRFTEKTIRQIRDAGHCNVRSNMVHAAQMGMFAGDYTTSLWLDSDVSSRAQAEEALSLVHQLAASTLPGAMNDASAVAARTGLIPAQTPEEWIDQIGMLDGISESLDTFLPQVFEQSPDDMVIATATKEWREERGHQMKASERRMVRKQAEDLVRPGATPKDLHAELKLVAQRQELWGKYCADGGWPILPAGFSQIRAQSALLEEQLTKLSELFGDVDFLHQPWEDITKALATLEEEEERLDSLPERNTLMKTFLDLGLGVFMEDIRARKVQPDALGAEFDLAYTSSVFEQLMVKSPVLASLGPRDISTLLEKMRQMDRAHVESLSGPVNSAVVEQMRSFAKAHKDATLSLDAILARDDAEALKEGIHSYPRIMQVARPVWIMPAGLMGEFIPPSPWADLVIVDADADIALSAVVPALLRGRECVVVGDVRRPQLVKASSGAGDRAGAGAGAVSGAGAGAGDAGSDRDGSNDGVASSTAKDNDTAARDNARLPELAITALARVFPVVELPTHRVQLNELTTMALIHHGYEGVYSPIPQNPRLRSASLVSVQGYGMPSLGGDGAVESTTAEVDAVVDAIADHAIDTPNDSLAVVAVNERHAARIREAFRKEAANSATLHAFVHNHKEEPFEILDISQAAGVHRDHVILAVGYGKTVHGRVLHSFGLLATPTGFLGLVDAIEAARCELTVISSLAAEDLDMNRISTPGPQLLANVISAAKHGFESSASGEPSSVIAPLIKDLAARLEMAGWRTAMNFGYEGSQRIPLVAGRDDIPGTWAVAVLLDDDEYVNERSLRRRDRHRVEAYEKAGWRLFQTFSTSLFVDPAGQADAVIAMLESVCDSHSAAAPEMKVPLLDEHGEEVPSQSSEIPGQAETAAGQAERAQRPEISVGLPLAAYSDDQLDDMLKWISSDGIMRTEVELREELRAQLGIERKGGQIDLVLDNAVRRSGFARN